MRYLLDTIHAAFHVRDSLSYRIVTPFIWLCITVSIVLLIIDILNTDTPTQSLSLERLDTALLAIFTIEYVLRISSYRPQQLLVFRYNPAARLQIHVVRRLLFALHPLNLIDLLTILGGSPALRGLRALRLLRLLRLIRSTKFFRYSNPFYGMVDAFNRNYLLFFGFSIVGACTSLGGLCIYLTEKGINPSISTLGDGIWWALVTLTTVGYGDISPVTVVGKVIAGALMVSGMFTLALFAGIVGQTLLSSVLSIREEQFRMSNTFKHIVIFGYEPAARALLDAITSEFDPNDHTLVIMSPFPRPIDVPLEFEWIEGDPTKEAELDKARLMMADPCIIAARRSILPQQADAITILTAFTLRSYLEAHPQQRKTPLHISCEILETENVQHAKTAGAEEVIETTRLGYSMLSHSIAQKGIGNVASNLMMPRDHNLYLTDSPLPLPMVFQQLHNQIQQEYGVMVIGIRNKLDQKDEINPRPNRLVTEEYELIYLSEHPLQHQG